MQECKFSPENDEVELLGSNILIPYRRGKPGNVFNQLMVGVGAAHTVSTALP